MPASLERRGDLRAFWAGRVFRIYPLYLVVFAAALLLLPQAAAGVGTAVYHPWLSAGADAVLLQDLLGVPNGLDVAWTLCYEMVFYYLVSGLFLLRCTGTARGRGRVAVVALAGGGSMRWSCWCARDGAHWLVARCGGGGRGDGGGAARPPGRAGRGVAVLALLGCCWWCWTVVRRCSRA
ncbi:hypothetical protein GXW82_22430 [Streptacidiphilus sp. 4-A2]|nr:hypothetical protein [Streptacidiphilus sp. 4-A2]